MADSTHRVEVVPVVLEKHPNADSLSIVRIEGYQAVVRTEDWYGCQELFAAKEAPLACLGAYIPPDSLVPVDRAEFAFLKDPKKPDQKQARVKARRLRGEWSMGLLIHAPVGAQLGDDVAEQLGVTHYDPPEPTRMGGESEAAPRRVRKVCQLCGGTGIAPGNVIGYENAKCEPCNGEGYPNDRENVAFEYPKYDVEAFRKYGRTVFEPEEKVWVTEKIHGANGRWLYDGQRYYCGSRTEWKRHDENNLWWKALLAYPSLGNFLFMNPGTCVYGEVYGQVQDLKYGTKPGEVRLAVFDILHQGKWVDAVIAKGFQPNPNGPPAWTLPWVPLIAVCEYDFSLLLSMAEGDTLIEGATHFREGIVIKPLTERWHPKCGRVNLKVVSNQYLERA
jgi:hypothetical protein